MGVRASSAGGRRSRRELVTTETRFEAPSSRDARPFVLRAPMPRPPTAKKAKPPKPDVVILPGGAAIAAVSGLRLKPRTGNVPRWWPVDKPGKAAFACNVPGVAWTKQKKMWLARHTNANGKTRLLGIRRNFENACMLRASVEDGHASKGDIKIVNGELCVTKCGKDQCIRSNVSIVEFAPEPAKHKKAFSEYAAALATLAKANSPADLRIVEKLRRSYCLRCRDVLHKSEIEGEFKETRRCRDMIKEIREQWISSGGCRSCGCKDRDVLEGDHKDRDGKAEYNQMMNGHYWAANGGVDAMREHYLGDNTTVQPLCMFCHALQTSHNKYKGELLSTLIPGTQKYRQRLYMLEKREYIDKHKMSKKLCQHPMCLDPRTGRPRVITPDNVHAFHCAHVDETEKEYSICDLASTCKTLKSLKSIIDRELAKCNVYCGNCHYLFETIPRRKEGRELLDALLARGAPVGPRAVKDERDDYFADMTDEERNAAFERLECGECE